jgi:hypothetical protein
VVRRMPDVLRVVRAIASSGHGARSERQDESGDPEPSE